MLFFLSGIVVGMIVFQTIVVASSIFRTLEPPEAGKVLRKIFPKLFAFLCFLGVVFLIISVLQHARTLIKLIGVASIVCPAICYAIVPATNRAKDEDNHKVFALLHRASVMLTMLVLLLNIAVLFLA